MEMLLENGFTPELEIGFRFIVKPGPDPAGPDQLIILGAYNSTDCDVYLTKFDELPAAIIPYAQRYPGLLYDGELITYDWNMSNPMGKRVVGSHSGLRYDSENGEVISMAP